MVTYVVGEAGASEHQIDHPPLFACREHKNLLKLAPRFVDELLATSQDVMPGNPDEIAQAFLRDAAPAYRLPEFLIPPKLFLFNPRGLRGAEALPYSIILIDRKFFGIPAYISPVPISSQFRDTFVSFAIFISTSGAGSRREAATKQFACIVALNEAGSSSLCAHSHLEEATDVGTSHHEAG